MSQLLTTYDDSASATGLPTAVGYNYDAQSIVFVLLFGHGSLAGNRVNFKNGFEYYILTEELYIYIYTVSYTHLDVYKRQV